MRSGDELHIKQGFEQIPKMVYNSEPPSSTTVRQDLEAWENMAVAQRRTSVEITIRNKSG
jgi:hypothetical protein